MDLRLKGKTALVAASSKGLGFGVARALALEGARVSLCSRDQASVDAAVKMLTDAAHTEVMGLVCDVTQAGSIQAWVDATAAKWSVIDALLVNAGGPPPGRLMSFSDEQWQAAYELTLMSTVRLIRATLPHMTNGGAILTITSSSIVEPIDNLGLSTVLRSGVAGVVKVLADELAADGIRVNNLLPGRLETERVERLDRANAERQGKTFEEVRAQSVAKIPLRRLGTTEEFGAAGAFLLSPAASYITGASLRIDGGQMRSI